MNDGSDFDVVIESLVLVMNEYAATGEHSVLRKLKQLAASADGPILTEFAAAVAVELRIRNIHGHEVKEFLVEGIRIGVNAMKGKDTNKIFISRSKIIGSNVGIDQRMSDCKNAVKSLSDGHKKISLEELISAVAAMLPSVADEKREHVVDDLNQVISQVNRENPRKDWLRLSADGLVEAAMAVGTVAQPVVDATRKLLELLY